MFTAISEQRVETKVIALDMPSSIESRFCLEPGV